MVVYKKIIQMCHFSLIEKWLYLSNQIDFKDDFRFCYIVILCYNSVFQTFIYSITQFHVSRLRSEHMVWRLRRRRKRVMDGGGAKTWVHLYSVTNQLCDLRLSSYYFGVWVCRALSVISWTMCLWFLFSALKYNDVSTMIWALTATLDISLFMNQSFHFLYYKYNSTFSTFLHGVTEIIWTSAHKNTLEKMV